MKQITLLLFLLGCLTLSAQRDMASVEARLLEFTANLEARDIDVYFTTTRYCNGETQMFVMPNESRCFSQGTYAAGYVVWQEDEETRIKKLDNCGMFASVALSDNVLFDFYAEHVASLQQNAVKPYEITERAGGPLLRTEIEDCHRKFRFVSEASEAKQQFRPFDLTNSAREKNINFQYNQELKITRLEAMLDKAINAMEANPVFRRL